MSSALVSPTLHPDHLDETTISHPQLFAIPDLDGKISALRNSLLTADLIEPGGWTPTTYAKDTHVVQLGDVVGKNQEALRILHAILELRAQGMNIDVLIGNHEAALIAALQQQERSSQLHMDKWLRTADGMSIAQELMRLYPEERSNLFCQLAHEIFDARGAFYELLGPQHAKAMLQDGNTLITHAPPDAVWLQRFVEEGIDGANAYFRSLLFDTTNAQDIAHRKGADSGILWSTEHAEYMYPPTLMKAVQECGIQHIVHGHLEINTPHAAVQHNGVLLHNMDIGIGSRMGSRYALFGRNPSGQARYLYGDYTGEET